MKAVIPIRRPTATRPTSKAAPNRPSKPKLGGLRSKFEQGLALQITERGLTLRYESKRLRYDKPHVYVTDFELPNGIFVEAKGWFKPSDRTKLLLVKEQHPEVDVRLVFQRAANKLNKGSSTTYALWAAKNGFKWAEGEIPDGWFREPQARSKRLRRTANVRARVRFHRRDG